MATYKVIQDIEAEDKLVGPLTLRQFIYAGVAAVSLYICFLAFTKNAQFLIAIFLPIAAAAGFFAFPWKGEQPTEIWALARLRFNIKPRVRIWDQDGAKDMVTITAPKILESKRPVRNLSQSEVRSRLRALADTIDSRGWATRNAAFGSVGQPWQQPIVAQGPGGMAAMIPSDDMFDTQSTVSQNLDAMLSKSQEQQRQRVLQQMAQAQNPQTYGPQAAIPTDYQSLPSPLMSGGMPNIPTPAAASAYSVAPEPAPMPIRAAAPPQMPGQPMAPPNNYWFANGPAYPVNPNINPNPMPQISQPQPQPYNQPYNPPMPISPPQQYSQPISQPAPLPPQPMSQPIPTLPMPAQIESDMPLAVAPAPTPTEAAMGEAIRDQNQTAMNINYGHMRVLQPISNEPSYAGPEQAAAPAPDSSQGYAAAMPTAPPEPVTPTPDPAILELANNDDLDIATIARQANKEINKAPDEVEIRLH